MKNMDKSFDRLDDENFRYVHYRTDSQYGILNFVQLGYRKADPGFSNGPWIRDHFVIHFIMKGKGRYEVNHKIYTVNAGQCFLMEPNQIVYFESDVSEPWEYYWFGFNGRQAHMYMRKSGFRISNPVRNIVCTDYVFNEFKKIDQLGNESHNLLAYNALLNNIVYHLIESTPLSYVEDNMVCVGNHDMSTDEYVNKALEMVSQAYNGNTSIEGIAQRLSLNHAYLCKIFKRTTGSTMKKYLMEYRLSQACLMMRDSTKPISDIALANGFNDPLYFSRCFRKHYGMSPSEYRLYKINTKQSD